MTERWDNVEIRATERRSSSSLFCLTFQLSPHMIEWNKSMKKHCHHYYYWGERGSFSHLPDTFNRHCNLGLSCPRTSITNEFMKLFTGRIQSGLPLSPCCWSWGLITGTCCALALTLTMNGSPVKGPGMLRLAPIHIQALLWADICVGCVYFFSSMRSLF